ncbi:transmembrane protein [Cystoisospora suis]|uniref:Transmembrane protein n=1 Tax=Cystoisospora suis TaxID=483139 RepID=A0A2C6L1H2_9APIC|nr:transmembrane protein [Cystoisospora suis]
MRTSRPFARELCLLDLSGTYGLSTSSRRQEQRLLSSSSYDEGGNNSFSSSPLSSLPRGLQVSKKLIRVYFAPSSPLFFIDGIRRGQRYLGPADLTAGMNRLTIPWVQWHLDRQAFLENNLSAMNILRADKQAASTVTAFFSPSTPASSRGERGGYGDGSPSRSLSAVQNGPVTRPVNALMVMRYDNLDGKASYDRGVGPGWRGPGDVYPPRRTLNYFEIIMHLNPLPPSAAAALAMESELGDFSAEHYIRLTALRDPDDLDENFLVAFLSGKSRRSSDGGGDSTPTPMIWLVACVAVLCLWAMLSAFFCSSTICWKRARIDGRRGPWAVGPAVSGPGGVVGAGSVIEAP